MNLTALTISAALCLLLWPSVALHAQEKSLDLAPDFFPVMPWDGGWEKPAADGSHLLRSVAECNFTVAGFVQPEDLALCEELGLKAIVAGPRDREPWKSKCRDVTDEVIRQAIKQRIDEGGGSRAVMGYYIVDEPGAPRFPALAAAVAAVKEHAPGKLAYINLFPGYATIGAPDKSQLGTESFTDYLEQFIEIVRPQFLSYDDYMVPYSDNFQDPARGAIYFSDLLEVRRVALKHSLPFWNTVSSNRIRPWTVAPSPANLMFQAYTTLAAGGKGIAWYTFTDRGYGYAPIDAEGRRTETWHYLSIVNAQIKVLGPVMMGLESTGVFFSPSAPAKDAPLLPGKVVKGVTSRASIKGYVDERPPVMVGEFKDARGGDWAMVVNLSLELSANILVDAEGSPEVVSALDGSRCPIDSENGHWLAPGQGVLLLIKPDANAPG